MTARVFVDTNVLVYSRDSSEPKKQARAQAWRDALWKARAGRLSAQVLHEFYVVVTRKLNPGMPKPRARAEVEDLAHWGVVELNSRLTSAAFDAEARHRLSFWDSLIVAAAEHAGCEYLLSEDFTAGREYGDLTVINPFEVEPAAVLGDG
jgi:predicted nucleic acid-binding protein